MARQTVVISFLGTQLDAGLGHGRWERWRPTVALAQREDRIVDRIELLYTRQHEALLQCVRRDIATVSPETEVRPVCLDITDPWDFGEVYGALYDWVRGYRFQPETEQYWTHITTGTHVAQICMFLLVEARFIPGVLLQTSPPRKRDSQPTGDFELIDLDLSRYDVLAKRFEQAQREALDFLKSGIATRNPGFNALIEEIERVAVRSRAPVLLTGPTGAGKSHLARRMFELKKARHQVKGEFVEVNCATLRGDGAASTLFGHKKGAFTGATADRAGLLRMAHEGVLFLDEIGELGADEQAMLLKAVEDRRFYPIGGDREVASDFQLIAGTNRDLRLDVARGRFREDLFARINLWSYSLPGLTERPEDLEPNIDHLLARATTETGRAVRFNAEAKARYLAFAQSAEALWSGNFRDLAASVTRLATLADGGRISSAQVEAELQRLRWLWQCQPAGVGGIPGSQTSNKVGNAPAARSVALEELLPTETLAGLDLFDRLQLEAVVAVCRQSRTLSEAGRTLFDQSRTQRSVVNDADRLRKYLHKHGLNWDAASGAGAAK